MIYLLSAVFGLIGGITRALVGILKDKRKNKRFKFKAFDFFFTIIASGFIGLFAGLLVMPDAKLSLLAGYAGTDFIESIYKIKGKQ